jgi:hypothetical protein
MSAIIPFPKAKPPQGMLDIYSAGQGLRGFDAMLPIALADRVLEIIKGAGVPVRFEFDKSAEILKI